MLLENSTIYTSLGWLWSVCAQSQPSSISLPCPDCGSQFPLKSKANAKGRKSNLLLREIHNLKNFKWGIFHPQRTALRVTLSHLSTLNILLILSFFRWLKFKWKQCWGVGGKVWWSQTSSCRAATSECLHNCLLEVVSLESSKQLKK